MPWAYQNMINARNAEAEASPGLRQRENAECSLMSLRLF
jgi:hypothetical protein